MELTVPSAAGWMDGVSIGSSLPSRCSDGDCTSFQVIWQNVTVTVNVKKQQRDLVSRFCGNVKNGEIVAILGPSGSGKTTFLNCVAGIRKPSEGNIQFYAKTKHNAIAYVTQADSLNLYLTVREALLFSSKLKNSSSKHKIDHNKIVQTIVEQLGLDNCVNNVIRKCSGGEVKRLSIGVEMTSNPNMLLVDELTSGLDSHSAYRCVDVLKNTIAMSGNGPMIIMTIHQPNTDLFNLFDRVYLLTNGSCIYDGSPSNIIDYFSSFQLFCPMYNNPADFALNIAANHYGNLSVQELKIANHKQNEIPLAPENGLRPMKQKYLKRNTSFFISYFLLMKSLALSYLRDPQQSVFRVAENILFPLLMLFVVKSSVATEEGCVLQMHNETHVLQENVYERYERQTLGITNLFLLYFNSLFIFFSTALPGVLTFPLRLTVFQRERLNNWYSTAAFFTAFITINSILSTMYALVNTTSFYYLTGQQTIGNFWQFLLINLLLAFFGDSFAFLVSLFVPRDPLTGCVCAGVLAFALQTFSGFIIRMKFYRSIAYLLSYASIFRYYFQACIKIFYSTSKCIIGEGAIFDFNTVLDFFRFYNYKNGESLDIVDSIPQKVRNSLAETVWTKAKLFKFAEEANDLSEEQIAELESFWVSKSSYILDEFGIQKDGILKEIGVMISMIVFLYILCFIFLVLLQRKRA